MSTGLNCAFVEYQPARWYYLLEDWDSPKGAWDWQEHATAYGPFGSEEEAERHLHRNHANPGGSYTLSYDPGFSGDDTLRGLIERAEK